ncbi:MAG: ATP-binding protein [Actinomycetota bacterium]
MIHGRERERSEIDRVLDAARAGHAGALVVRGDVGVGKTAMLEDTLARGRDMTILTARGVESEAELAFACLAVLLQPVLGRLDALPGAQADALRSALAVGDSAGEVGAHQLAIGAGTLGLLAEIAHHGPVLVVVDDAHWIDEPSGEALAFAARRLAADGVALLVAVRGDERCAFDDIGLAELALQGLDEPATIDLLSGRGVAADVARQLHQATAGNPLALVEVVGLLDDDQRRGTRSLDDPVPIADRFRQLQERRLAGFPAGTRTALLLAAAEPTGDLGAVGAALGHDLAALEPAETAGVVRIGGDRIEFAHPLVRSAVYYGASPAERRDAHGHLARALPGERETERRAWHLAAAALGPDEKVAALLEQTAADARRRGGLTAAASAFERAAQLSPDAEEKARRLLGAGEALWLSGQLDRAVPVLDTARATTRDPGLRGDVTILRGQAEIWRRGPRLGYELLVAEADALEATDPERAALLLTHAVNALLLGGDVRRALPVAERAQAAADRAAGTVPIAAQTARAQALLLHGETARALALLEPLQQLAVALAGSGVPEAEHLVQVIAFADVVLEEWDRARELAEGVTSRARREGTPGVLGFSSAVLAGLNWRTGRWAEAYATASTDVLFGVTGEERAGKIYAQAFLAQIEAGLGRTDDCRTHATAALGASVELGMGSVLIWASAALGLLELGLGNYEAAIARFAPIARASDGWEVREPGVVWWTGDGIEAYWRAGRVDDARRLLTTLERQAETTSGTWAKAVAARGRGLLAPDDGFEECFAEALDWHDRTASPF